MTAHAKAPHKLRGVKLVAFSGGPRDRAWVTLDDWHTDVAAAKFNGETPHAGRTLGYLLTEGMIDHPVYIGLSGLVARWNPNRVAELLATQEALS